MTDIEKLVEQIPPHMLKRNLKFVSKLTFDQRCQILALDWIGMSRRVTAVAFGVARSTVAYICNPSSPHYRDVRKRFADLGRERFIAEYLTQDVISHVNSFQDHPDVALSMDSIKERESIAPATPQYRANKFEGEHTLTDPRFPSPYSVEVFWVDGDFDDSAKGWAVVMRKSELERLYGEADADYHYNEDVTAKDDDPTLFRTSKQALEAWMAYFGATPV